MKKVIVASFLFIAQNAIGIESGNVVGYMTENVRAEGVTVNRFRKPSGEPTMLSELMQDVPLGAEISFFNGAEWVTATADMDAEGGIHWFDKRTDELADNYEVPTGAGVRYKLPEGTTGTFVFDGEIHDSYFGGAAAIFDGGMTLDDVRLPQNAIDEILRALPVVTNKVTVTNTPPNRFALRMRSGELRAAMWNVETLALCDPNTGFNFKFPLSSVDRFEVDNTAQLGLRMNETAVARLEELYLAEVIRERNEKAEAEKKETEKKIAESVTKATDSAAENIIEKLRAVMMRTTTWLIALGGFIISTVASYYMGKFLDCINPRLMAILKKLKGIVVRDTAKKTKAKN